MRSISGSLSATGRVAAATLAVAFTTGAVPAPARAEWIDTDTSSRAGVGPSAADVQVANREELISALTRRGVAEDDASARVAALADGEVAMLVAGIDQLPAGAGLVGWLVFGTVALIVTDVFGLTKIFPFTRSVR